MKYEFSPISPEDREAVIDTFNYYIENSFAAYPETRVPYEFFDFFLQAISGYPNAVVKDENKKLLGFCMLRPHSPMPTFSGTAEISYFIRPEYTGKTNRLHDDGISPFRRQGKRTALYPGKHFFPQ